MSTQLHLRTALLALLLCPSVLSQGRIVVAHDEWTLSNTGFASAPTTTNFVQDVAAWFTGGQPGNFRAWSNSMGLNQLALANAMTSAGHTWTVSTAGTFDLATLQQYDAVFLGVYATGIDVSVLTSYVDAGGCVYLCAGAGGAGFAATTWNPFLQNFGLAYASVYNNFGGLEPISSSHPIFAGVTGLYEANGNSITDTTPTDPSSSILVTESGQGIYAVYDGGLAVTTYCTAKLNSLGCTPAISMSNPPSASAGSGCVLGTVNVIGNKNGLYFHGTNGALGAPFHGGFLCVKAPTKRHGLLNSGGTGGTCNGAFTEDLNGYIASGADPSLVAGATVHVQCWSRDPSDPFTDSLSDAVAATIQL